MCADCQDLVNSVDGVSAAIATGNSVMLVNLPSMVTALEGIEANTRRIYEYLYSSPTEQSITDIVKELQPYIEKISELTNIGVSTAGIRSALYDDISDTNMIDIAIALQPHLEKVSELTNIGVSATGIRSALYDDASNTNMIDIAIALQPHLEKVSELTDINTNTSEISRSLHDPITDKRLIDIQIEIEDQIYLVGYFLSGIMYHLQHIKEDIEDIFSEAGITYNMIRVMNQSLNSLEAKLNDIRNILSSTLSTWSELGISDLLEDKLDSIIEDLDMMARRQIGMSFHTKSGTTLLDLYTSSTVENDP